MAHFKHLDLKLVVGNKQSLRILIQEIVEMSSIKDVWVTLGRGQRRGVGGRGHPRSSETFKNDDAYNSSILNAINAPNAMRKEIPQRYTYHEGNRS
jgi:hypothetical protein